MKPKPIAIALVALFIQSLSAAQGGPPPGMQGGFGGPGNNEISLLGRNDVQTDLQLTDEQKTKVQTLVKKYRRGPGPDGPGRDGQGGPPGGGFDPEEMEKQMAEQKKAVSGVLTEAQVKRLGEIKIQIQGSSSALDPEIQKKLDITDEQKDKIQVAMDEQRENMRPPDFANGERPDFKQMQAEMKKMQAKMNAAIDAILTADQRAKLKELGGKPFKQTDVQVGPRGGGGK